ncbi:MAG: pentapeptide repeat-containing protein [Phycisphaerales bacterium]
MRSAGDPTVWAATPPNLDAGELRTPEEIVPPRAGDRISEWRIVDSVLNGSDAPDLEFDRVLATGAGFSGVRWRGVRIVDTRFERVDLSNAVWSSGRLTRVRMESSRLTGMSLAEGSLADVRFDECRADLSSWQAASFDRVEFRSTILREADFSDATFDRVRFRGCDLRGARFGGARCRCVDLRGSRIERIQIDRSQAAAFVVDAAQTVDLALALGVRVEPLRE